MQMLNVTIIIFVTNLMNIAKNVGCSKLNNPTRMLDAVSSIIQHECWMQ